MTDGSVLAHAGRPVIIPEADRAWGWRCRNRVVVLLDCGLLRDGRVALVRQGGVDAGEEVMRGH